MAGQERSAGAPGAQVRNYLGLPGARADRLARSAAGPDGRIDEAEYALAAGQMQARPRDRH